MKMLMRSSGLWLGRMPRVHETLEHGWGGDPHKIGCDGTLVIPTREEGGSRIKNRSLPSAVYEYDTCLNYTRSYVKPQDSK